MFAENGSSKSEKYITATHAIFYNEDGNEAPGVVVGFQITYKFLKNKVENVSKNVPDYLILF